MKFVSLLPDELKGAVRSFRLSIYILREDVDFNNYKNKRKLNSSDIEEDDNDSEKIKKVTQSDNEDIKEEKTKFKVATKKLLNK